MTVVAWDGRTLAADKRAVNAGMQRTVTKVRKLPIATTDHRPAHYVLVAGSGSFDQVMLMTEWVRAGEDPATFPASQRDKDAYASMVIIDENRVYVIEQLPVRFRVEDQLYAMGSGRDFAMMAMHLGKSAAEAVELAALYQTDCGNGVDAVTLE